VYDNQFTGEFPAVSEYDMAKLADLLPERMALIADEHRGVSLSIAAVWILSDGILRVVLHVKEADGEQAGALLGYDVAARQRLRAFPSTTQEDLADLFIWEYLAGDAVRAHAAAAVPGRISWIETVIDIPRPTTVSEAAGIPGIWIAEGED
jgi:hypothetical protein